MRDPVLERDMFRGGYEGAPSSEGVVSLVKGESDYERRKKRALELLAEARDRQDPEKFKTLSEQNRPGVFRPVATGQPQAPQPNTQQQMAQMQAMGFRPVGMAYGGYVQRFAEGSGPAGVTAYPGLGPDPSKWTDEEIEAYVENLDAQEEATPAGRSAAGIMGLDPKSTKERKARTLRNIRDQAIENKALSPDKLGDIGQVATAARSRTEPSIFEPSTPQEYEQKRLESRLETQSAIRDAAIERGVGEDFVINKPPLSQTEGGSGDYMRGAPYRPSEAQISGSSGTYIPPMSSIPAADIAGSSGTYIPPVTTTRGVPASQVSGGSGTYIPPVSTTDGVLASNVAGSSGDYIGKLPSTLSPREGEDPTGRAEIARMKTQPSGIKATEVGVKPSETPSSGSDSSGIAQLSGKQTTTMEGIKAERARERAENINLALIQAGLAMAAGTSPNAMTNIGQGGISGLQAFSQSETESRRAMREDQRAAREEERANRTFDEQRRQFEMTFGEAGRRFDIESQRADRQMNIAQDQFQKTFGLSMDKAKQDERQFQQTFGLSVQEAELRAKQFAADQDYKIQSLANDKEKLNLARDQLKAETEQAIATRDSKKLESSSSLASQILNATNARIAALRASQKQNAMMGITDPSVEAEIDELRRQAQEAKQNYYAVQESLGIRLPGAEIDPFGIRR